MANNGPSLTKATYDKKRTRGPAPVPDRHKMALTVETARLRNLDERVHKDGLAVALGLIKPKPPFRRI